jgi:2,5-dioxopentanoate dehydrogenase
MELHGGNLIAGAQPHARADGFRAVNPSTGAPLEPVFVEAAAADVDEAARAAEAAFEAFAALAPERRAAFLRAIGSEISALGDALLQRAAAETGLPLPRLTGERGRTLGQIAMFADLVAEGSWVDARVDRALPERQPAPRPDVRRMLVALGPVAVFGASNFPLAFSVAGGDTISALAAGCPVIVKGHPAHPGTSELVGRAIAAAIQSNGLPAGVFGLLQGASTSVGAALVTHPLVKAVGFTGSLRGGRALYDLAAARPEPIPVFAEMGSSNPLFILPRALAERGEALARGLVTSVTMGAGQFCTNPGLTLLVDSPEAATFLRATGDLLAAADAGTMVHAGIKRAYDSDLDEVAHVAGVKVAARSTKTGAHATTGAQPALLIADAQSYSQQPRLARELYGPATLALRCRDMHELLEAARGLGGHLTASVHGTEADLAEHAELLGILRRKVGRVIVNGFPTGVEVCASMHHGGPYPATTDSRATSVGTAAILRFARPVCFQDFPQAALPAELQDKNPCGIWRLVDGAFTRDPL